jgi:hypothetical protein
LFEGIPLMLTTGRPKNNPHTGLSRDLLHSKFSASSIGE